MAITEWEWTRSYAADVETGFVQKGKPHERRVHQENCDKHHRKGPSE